MLRLDGIIFTIINLVILYVAMRHFLIGPIQSVLAKRKELIDSQFAKAEEKEAEALELKDKYDDMLSHTKEESARILETSRECKKRIRQPDPEGRITGKSDLSKSSKRYRIRA